jgi:hypothetical protein
MEKIKRILRKLQESDLFWKAILIVLGFGFIAAVALLLILSFSAKRMLPEGNFQRHKAENLVSGFGSERALANILEVGRPVRMLPVTPRSVPMNFPVFFESFGADQCASSEGFLVTLTPGEGSIVIFCDYSLCSKEICQPHRFIPFKIRVGKEPGHQLEQPKPSGFGTLSFEGLSMLRTQLTIPKHFVGMNRPRFADSPERGMRHNLMMTAPRPEGILVASNPTDEGRIGTGRNTWRGLDEKSIN